MNLNSIQPAPGSKRAKKRLGRGRASGKGKTATHGHKGQMARAGHKRKATFEGGQMPLVRRIPKRGFKNITRSAFSPVNVSALNRFAAESEVAPEQLRARGLTQAGEGPVKILGTGEVEQAVHVKAHAFSRAARQKIEAAGGSCEVLVSAPHR